MSTVLIRGGDRLAKTTALASSLEACSSRAILYDVWGYSGANQYIQVHDATTLASASVPIAIIAVSANQHFSFSVGGGMPCNTGIVLCRSSSPASKVVGAGAADCMFFAAYKMM